MTKDKQPHAGAEREAQLIQMAKDLIVTLEAPHEPSWEPQNTVALALVTAYCAGKGDAEAANAETVEKLDKALTGNARLANAIRNHRSKTGNDLCWENDIELWAALNDGATEYPHKTVPPCEEFLANCKKYWESRQDKKFAV